MKKLVSMIALLLAMLLCLGSVAVAESTFYQLGDKMDDFTVTTHDGRSLTLSEVLKEKDAVLINFWATWCNPCRNEFPFMEEAYQQYADKVEIIKARDARIVDLERQLAVATTSDFTRYPFKVGVAEEREQTKM